MDAEVDALYRSAFKGASVTVAAAAVTAASPSTAAPAPVAAAATARAPAAGAAAAAAPEPSEVVSFPDGLGEAEFGDLGRSRPEVMRALLESKERSDPDGWRQFQAAASTLKLKRSRILGQVSEARGLLDAAERAESKAAGLERLRALSSSEEDGPAAAVTSPAGGKGLFQQLLGGLAPGAAGGGGGAAAARPVRIVLVCGFESFNVGLYQQAARKLARAAPHVTLQVRAARRGADGAVAVLVGHARPSAAISSPRLSCPQPPHTSTLRPYPPNTPSCPPPSLNHHQPNTAPLPPRLLPQVFSDRDVAADKGRVAAALAGADAFFGSLLFDYDTVRGGWVVTRHWTHCRLPFLLSWPHHPVLALSSEEQTTPPRPQSHPTTSIPFNPRWNGSSPRSRASPWCSCLRAHWSSWAARASGHLRWTPRVGDLRLVECLHLERCVAVHALPVVFESGCTRAPRVLRDGPLGWVDMECVSAS